MVATVHKWFMSEVYFWRTLASTLWSIICLPGFLSIYIALSKLSFSNFWNWPDDVLETVASVEFWVTVLVLEISMVAILWLSLQHFAVSPEVQITYWASLSSLVRWSRLPMLVLCSLSGFLSAWIISQFLGHNFSYLSKTLNYDSYEVVILNEPHLFLVLAGLFAGASYYREFFHHHLYYLPFPILQRFKIFEVRSELSSLVYSCLWQTFHTVKYFYISYCFFGIFLKRQIHNSFSIFTKTEETQLDTLMGILDFYLFWQIYLFTYLLKFSWSFSRTLIAVFHTQHYEFPIESGLELDKLKTLPEALACSTHPLLQHLAFLDVSRLSRFSPSRRQEVLSLSQPGGHPRIWVATYQSLLLTIDQLTRAIREENSNLVSKTMNPASPVDAGQQIPESEEKLEVIEVLAGVSKALVIKMLKLIKNFPIINLLFVEHPDASSRKLYASCQLQIWAVEGLSCMAVKSYTEDKYGIVQRVLPEIITSLLDLYEAVEKHLKLSSAWFRRQTSSSTPDGLLRYKLHAVTKASIYRIVNTYRQHTEDMKLGFDCRKKVQPFLDYTI